MGYVKMGHNYNSSLKIFVSVSEKAEALMKDSKFDEAIALLDHLPPTLSQQMKMVECYIRLRRDSKALKCIENMKALVPIQHTLKAVDVYELGVANSEKSFHESNSDKIHGYMQVKSMIFLACASKMYLSESNADEAVRGMKDCSFQCDQVIQKMSKLNERMEVLASDIGKELLDGIVDDITSASGDAKKD